MLASGGTRKLVMSRQLYQHTFPRGGDGQEDVCLSMEVFPNKALQLGSSFLLDGDRTLCIGPDCCISLKTLPMITEMRGSKKWGAGAQSPCRVMVSLTPYSRQIVKNVWIHSAGDGNLLNPLLNFGMILVCLRKSVYQQSHSMSA